MTKENELKVIKVDFHNKCNNIESIVNYVKKTKYVNINHFINEKQKTIQILR